MSADNISCVEQKRVFDFIKFGFGNLIKFYWIYFCKKYNDFIS